MTPNIKEEEDEKSDEENTEDDRKEINLSCLPSKEIGIEERLRNPSELVVGQPEPSRGHFDQEHSSLTMDQLCHLLGLIVSLGLSWAFLKSKIV